MLTKLGKTSQVQPYAVTSWKGGLNETNGLYTTSQDTIRDACDIVFEPDGSICTRKENTAFATTGVVGGIQEKAWVGWEDENSSPWLIWMDNLGQLHYIGNGPGPQLQNIFQFSIPGPTPMATFQANGKLYLSNGAQTLQWDSSLLPLFPGVLTDVTTTSFHDGIAVPANAPLQTDLGVPAFSEAVSWSGAAWIASPVLNTTTPLHHEEVWWSLPFKTYSGVLTGEQDYSNARSLSFVTQNATDRILALEPAGEQMYVFKSRSIFKVTRSDFDLSAFRSSLVTTELGLANRRARATFDGNVVFYDEDRGLHIVTPGGEIVYMMEAIDHVKYDNLNTNITAVGVVGTKIYMSVALNQAEYNDTTYIYDTLTKTWTKSCRGYVEFLRYRPTNNNGLSFGTPTNDETRTLAYTVQPCESIVTLEAGDQSTNIDEYGCGDHPFYPTFTTNFSDYGSPQIDKQGVCFTFSFEGIDATIKVESFDDWNESCSVASTVQDITGTPDSCEVPDRVILTEVFSPTVTRTYNPTTHTNGGLNVEGITEVNHNDKCVFTSKSHKVTTLTGAWCLRRVSHLYKLGRFRV